MASGNVHCKNRRDKKKMYLVTYATWLKLVDRYHTLTLL